MNILNYWTLENRYYLLGTSVRTFRISIASLWVFLLLLVNAGKSALRRRSILGNIDLSVLKPGNNIVNLIDHVPAD